ncbi:MAG: hypothetical protein WC936_06565 [Candidatus Nanoarchaeia archaeon]|jgi:hypothetical protein
MTLRSPRYNFTIAASAIAAGGSYLIELEKNEKYAENAPYNDVLIRNFSGQRITISYGDTMQIMGASEVMHDTEAYGTRRIIIKNSDTTVANDDIIFVMVSRNITADHCIISDKTGENIYTIASGGV